MGQWDLCCRFYPSCACAAELERLSREHASRQRGCIIIMIATALLVVCLVALVSGCGPRSDPANPTERPSEMYTVIRPG